MMMTRIIIIHSLSSKGPVRGGVRGTGLQVMSELGEKDGEGRRRRRRGGGEARVQWPKRKALFPRERESKWQRL